MDTEQLESLDWDYHGEGNANIIFKNFNYKIALRLRKVNNDHIVNVESNLKKISNSYSLEQEQRFKSEILSLYLIGNKKYLHESRLVFLSQKFIKKITNSKLDLKRPDIRKTKFVEQKPQFGIVMPFLNFFDCAFKLPSINFVSVELKPKWGCLPISQNVNVLKQSVCRFCLHQNLKSSKDFKKAASKYCPLDLYGDCKCKVSHAIAALLETPQNNLKLTVNGSFMKAKDFFLNTNMTKESFCKVLSEIIYTDSKEESQNETLLNDAASQVCLNSKFHQHETRCIKQGTGGIFNLLRKLQQLDRYDIENIYAKYSETLDKFGFKLEEFIDFDSRLWNEFKTRGFVEKVSDEFDVFEICHFLVAATFKDCSVMITFCEVDDVMHSARIVESCGKFFMYEIKLIDLDPRSVFNIPYYHSLDQSIVASWK